MQTFTFLLPRRDNAGKSTAPQAQNEFRDAVLKIAGGYTFGADVHGAWRDPLDGTVFYDTSIPVTVALARDAQLGSKVLKLRAAFFRAFPDQRTVYISSGNRAAIVGPPEAPDDLNALPLSALYSPAKPIPSLPPVAVPVADGDVLGPYSPLAGGGVETMRGRTQGEAEDPDKGDLEELAVALRAKARKLSDASWALDSARSLAHKARSGYRSSPVTGDFPWDRDAIAAQLDAAVATARDLV